MLELAVIIALCVLFIHVTMWEGMVFSGISDALSHLPAWMQKITYECVICMTPYYGTIIFMIINPDYATPADFIFTIMAASGINVFSSMIIEKIKGE